MLFREKLLKTFVKDILNHSSRHDWTIMGFGMLRTYLPDDTRVNLWHSEFRTPNVSMIHTHPWNFHSLIVSGKLVNVRYTRQPAVREDNLDETYYEQTIIPGHQGHLDTTLEPNLVVLKPREEETYHAGETYYQSAYEIHKSLPEDGCVTVNMRTRVGEDKALTYWPRGTEWVSAIPRPATPREIMKFTEKALEVILDE